MAASTALAARIVLAGALAWAGLAKLRDRSDLPSRLRALGFPGAVARPLATLLPLVELALAVALLATPRSTTSAWIVLTLLGAFTVVLVATLRRGVPCPCFGSSGTATGARTLVRNAVLMAVAVLATGSTRNARAASVAEVATVLGLLAAGAVVAADRRGRGLT